MGIFGKKRKSENNIAVNIFFIFLALIFVCLGLLAAYYGLNLESNHADLMGVYEFKATSSDHVRESETNRVKNNNHQKRKYLKTTYTDKYYIIYSAEGTEYTFKDSVSKERYDDFNKGGEISNISKSVWKVGNILRYENENATENEVLEREAEKKSRLFSIAAVFVIIGVIIIIVSVMKISARKRIT